MATTSTATLVVLLAAGAAGLAVQHLAHAKSQPFLGHIPSINAKVTALRFFENPSKVPPREQREYAHRFGKGDARFIAWELTLEFPAPGRRLEVPIEQFWHRADGSLLARQTARYPIEADSNWLSANDGWGWKERGHWPAGSYRVDLYIEGRKMASDSFRIYAPGNDAIDAYNKGTDFFKAEKYHEAIAYFDQAIRLYPEYVKAYNNRCAAYGELGKYDQSIADCTQALRIEPRDASGYSNRGIGYRKKGQHDQALADYANAIALDPNLASAYVNRGNLYYETGEHANALADFHKAQALGEKFGPANEKIFAKLRQAAQAGKPPAEASKQAPQKVSPAQSQAPSTTTLPPSPAPKAAGDATAHLNRGLELADEEKYDEAIVEYTKAIKIDPQYVLAYTNRGAAYHDKSQYNQAISDYTKAIELNPKSVFAYSNRAEAYYNKGQYDLAIADYTKAIALNPKDDVAYSDRADAYYNKGQYDLAIADYTKGIALNPKDDVAYSNRAAAYYHTGQYDQAISDYTKAIEINPKDADAYSSRAATYREKGQYDQAISDASKAIALNPKHGKAYSNRGMSYYRKGDYANALDDLNKAQTLGKKVDAKLLDELRKATQTSTQPAEASKPAPEKVTPDDSQEIARLVERISNNYKDTLSIELLGAFKEDKNPFSAHRGLSIERERGVALLLRSLSCGFHSREYRDPRDGIVDCDKRRNGLEWTETTSAPIPFPQIQPTSIKLSESTGNFAGSDPAISFGYEGYDPMSVENMGFDKNGKPFFILPPGPMRIECKNRSACEQMAADLKRLVEIARNSRAAKPTSSSRPDPKQAETPRQARRDSSQVEPPAPSKVDPALVGMWDQTVPMPAGMTRWEISIGGDGAFTFRSEGPGATPSYVGTFQTSGGRWTLSAPTVNWFDGGGYQLPTPDMFVMQGKLGTGTWKKMSQPQSRAQNQAPSPRSSSDLRLSTQPDGMRQLPKDLPELMQAATERAQTWRRDAIPVALEFKHLEVPNPAMRGPEVRFSFFSPSDSTGLWVTVTAAGAGTHEVSKPRGLGVEALPPVFVDLPTAVRIARANGTKDLVNRASLRIWSPDGAPAILAWMVGNKTINGATGEIIDFDVTGYVASYNAQWEGAARGLRALMRSMRGGSSSGSSTIGGDSAFPGPSSSSDAPYDDGSKARSAYEQRAAESRAYWGGSAEDYNRIKNGECTMSDASRFGC